MNTIRTILYTIAGLLAAGLSALSADTNAAAKFTTPPTSTGLYSDAGISVRTADFDKGNWGFVVGVGYQVSKHWAADIRIAHQGLDANGSAVQDLGGRLVARMPFEYLSPYTFLGGTFDLERDRWHLEPGVGIELGARVRTFAEIGLDSELLKHRLETGYKLTAGLRLRF